MFNENKKKQQNPNSENETVQDLKANNHVRVITPMTEEYIYITSQNFTTENPRFLIDSGADMNFIKLSTLKSQVVVNTNDKGNIKRNKYHTC